jgi:hypothetical protein
MGIITKGMGIIMKSKMKAAGVTKPTFPGPRTSELLDKVLKKDKFRRGADKIEGPLKMRKDMRTGAQKPGASAIEIDARINKKYR